MEDRSSRRMRTLVTQMAHRGLSAKKNACALISMMARSTNRSNQRPDTLMQDRKRTDRRNLLQRTAGPYIRVRLGRATHRPGARMRGGCSPVTGPVWGGRIGGSPGPKLASRAAKKHRDLRLR